MMAFFSNQEKRPGHASRMGGYQFIIAGLLRVRTQYALSGHRVHSAFMDGGNSTARFEAPYNGETNSKGKLAELSSKHETSYCFSIAHELPLKRMPAQCG
jgi:hypothetical protein